MDDKRNTFTEENKLSENEKNIMDLIKDKNNVVSYHIEDDSITLTFFDGVEPMDIEFFIGEDGTIQTKIVKFPSVK